MFIVGWSLDGRIALRRPPGGDGAGGDEAPDRLRDLIDFIARRRPDLKVHILLWDYTMLYAADRQWLPAWDFDWTTAANVRFKLDDKVPLGGSHHQKLVAIDDRLAFVGGIDLAGGRWDTRAHDPEDPRRTDHVGRPEGAFHDVQLAVDGDAARAVGELCRQRWRAATGEALEPVTGGGDPWPESVPPDWCDIDVGIARTLPQTVAQAPVRENLAAYRDAIAAATDTIYIENQYLASGPIAEALADRLAESHGPEVVIVSQRRTTSWMEEQVMGIRRKQILYRLHQCDEHGHLRILWPCLPGLDDEKYDFHAKVCVVDDRLVRVGSANLNNRSMGYDSECDLLLVCTDEAQRAAARAFRDGLVAEHLGVEPRAVSDAVAQHGSLIAAIDALNSAEGRRLETLEPPETPPEHREILTTLGDPERPISPAEWLRDSSGGAGGLRRLRAFFRVWRMRAGRLLASARRD